jgi:NRPS condensation-like uncharacterized protein
MTIHFEVTIPESIDGARFRRAVQTVMEQSARLRSRVAMKRWTSNALRWREFPAYSSVDVTEVECTRAELAEVRDAFVGRGFDVTTDPLIRFRIAHHGSEGSSLIVLSHHVLSDATGIWAVIVQIAEQYGREADGADSGDPSGSGSMRGVDQENGTADADDDGHASVGPVRAIIDAARAIISAPRPERISGRGAIQKSDEVHVELRIVEAQVLDAILNSALLGSLPEAKLNDALLLALHRALAEWNMRCGQVPDRISVTMPINQRRRGDRTLRNSAGQGATVSSHEERLDPEKGLRAIVDQSTAIKRDRGRADPSSSAGSLWFLPTGIRALIPRIVGFVSRERFLNTSRLSNMGRVDFPQSGLQFTNAWLSAPTRMPQGATVCVLQSGPNITIGLRCCRALWDRPAAQEFADLLMVEIRKLSAS